MSEERFDRIELQLEELKKGQADLKEGLGVQLRDLSNQMGTMYEKLADDIKALSLPVPELERRWRADDAIVVENVGRRLDPLEKAVRKHFGTE